MKIHAILIIGLAWTVGCGESANGAASAAASAAAATTVAGKVAAPPGPPKKDADKTVADVAAGSKDHTTLVAALTAAGLVESLNSPGGVYTVFAPTNAAFDKLPKGTVEELLKPEKLADLKGILQHHAAVPILQLKDIKDGQTQAMADGKKVTFHVKDGKVMVEDANILATVPAMNGVVYVVDAVLVPH